MAPKGDEDVTEPMRLGWVWSWRVLQEHETHAMATTPKRAKREEGMTQLSLAGQFCPTCCGSQDTGLRNGYVFW